MQCINSRDADLSWPIANARQRTDDKIPHLITWVTNWPLQKLREDWELAFNDLISGIVWVTSVSYNWSMVSKVNQNYPNDPRYPSVKR